MKNKIWKILNNMQTKWKSEEPLLENAMRQVDAN